MLGIVFASAIEVEAAHASSEPRARRRLEEEIRAFSTGVGKEPLRAVSDGIGFNEFLDHFAKVLGMPQVHRFSTTALAAGEHPWPLLIKWGMPDPLAETNRQSGHLVLNAYQTSVLLSNKAYPSAGQEGRGARSTVEATQMQDELERTLQEVAGANAQAVFYWNRWEGPTGLRLAVVGLRADELKEALASRNPGYLLALRRDLITNLEPRRGHDPLGRVSTCPARELSEMVLAADGDRHRLATYDEIPETVAFDALCIQAQIGGDRAKIGGRHSARELSPSEQARLQSAAAAAISDSPPPEIEGELVKRWHLPPSDLGDPSGGFRFALENEVAPEVAKRLASWTGRPGHVILVSCVGH